MKSLSELHINLKAILSSHPDFKESLLDFYLKSLYEQYIDSIKATQGRKFCITGMNTDDIKKQLKKIILISDTIVFHTTDYNHKPTLDAFPFPSGFNSDLIRIMTLAEEGGKDFIPNAAEVLSAIGMATSDKNLELLYDTILGYDVDNPKNSYRRNQYTLSSSRLADANGVERPVLVGLTERYSKTLYDFIFDEADYLFTNGNLVFSPYIRTSSNGKNILHNILKAGAINTNLSVMDSKYSITSAQIDILNNIDIPYIENVPFKVLCDIIKDEGEALSSFRKLFIRTIEDIQDLDDKESIKKEIKYIKRNLFEDELEKVEQVCKKVSKMKTLSSFGAVVTTAVIGISAYFGLDIASIIMAGGGTGLATANELYKHYIDSQELKSNPMYLLWKI